MEIIISNTKIKGLIGATPPHIYRGDEAYKKELSFDDLLLDVGASSKEEALKVGV